MNTSVNSGLSTLGKRLKQDSFSDVESIIRIPRTLNFFNTLNLFIALVIGAGIFITAQEIAILVPCSGIAILVWFAVGVLSFIGTLSYCELACTFPENGSDLIYFQKMVKSDAKEWFIFCRL